MHTSQSFPFGNFVLAHQQVMIVFFISKNKEGVSVKELAKTLRVTSSAITQFIDGLVEKKLVKRENDEHDRRLIKIKLSPKAAQQFSRFESNNFVKMSQAFENFSISELEQFSKLIGKIKSCWSDN